MSSGLDTLLEAAHYIEQQEQQEKLGLSPQDAVPMIVNDCHFIANYSTTGAVDSSPTTSTASSSPNNIYDDDHNNYNHLQRINFNGNNNNYKTRRNFYFSTTSTKYGILSPIESSSTSPIIDGAATSSTQTSTTYRHFGGTNGLTVNGNSNSNSSTTSNDDNTTGIGNNNQHLLSLTTALENRSSRTQQHLQHSPGSSHHFEFSNGNTLDNCATVIAKAGSGRSNDSYLTSTNNANQHLQQHHHPHHQHHILSGNCNSSSINNNNNNSSNSSSNSSSHPMVIDDNLLCHTFLTGINSSHSPPRNNVPYMQLLSTAQQQQHSGSQLTTPFTSHITSAGRRRTISSNSNGAGTRETHNKLEKNRRAHLKECYEQLKNELPLKDEDRKKTSNLSILSEAHSYVEQLKMKVNCLESEMEQLAKDKINLNKQIVSLKRGLGSQSEQHYGNINIDSELGSIPSEGETMSNDVGSLSLGRGGQLYSSSSSLSSGVSNTMSSPVAAGLQTGTPTIISPVINKINTNFSNSNNNGITVAPSNGSVDGKVAATTIESTVIATASSIALNLLQNANLSNISNNIANNIIDNAIAKSNNNIINMPITTNASTTVIASHGISANSVNGNINSPIASPTEENCAGGGSTTSSPSSSSSSSLPLSLTAKNISATSLTRGSPTPSTPSPSSSSSSGVSSSSSLISSSPPINGTTTNGRSVTVNIPNNLKFKTVSGGVCATVRNLTNSNVAAVATITSATSPNNGGAVVAGNNAIMLQAFRSCHLE